MLPIWYHSDETGAPALNNTAGSLIALLDALLITGFNTKAVTSVSVSAGVATAVISGHGYEVGKTLLIAGATPTGLNGNQVITAVVDANTVRWAAAGVPDGAATGTITAKRAPLGWVKAFAGTNKAIYQRTDPQATSMLWRVDDTAAGVAFATYARALMVETAVDVDTYTAAAPQSSHLSGGVYISKGENTAASKRWLAVGDGRTLHFFSDDTQFPFASHGGLHGAGFGDLNSWRSAGDAYGCLIWGGVGTNGLNYTHLSSNAAALAGGIYVARGTNHIGGSTAAVFQGRTGNGRYVGVLGDAEFPAYPSSIDGGMGVETVVLVREYSTATSHQIRGTMRGMAHPLNAVGTSLHRQVISNFVGTTDQYLVVGCVSQGQPGSLLFNITSEW